MLDTNKKSGKGSFSKTVSAQNKPLSSSSGSSRLIEFLFRVEAGLNPVFFYGRAVLFLVVFIWGLRIIFSSIESNYAGETFLHLINTVFHEAGHIFLSPFGQFMMSLGGSIGQLSIPLSCLFVFLIKTKDNFAAAIALWWFGENFIDLAPYINDTKTLGLPLLGGNTDSDSPYGFHDWEYLLTETGLLQYAHTLAWLSHILGSILILLSFAWAGYLLIKQYRKIREG